MLPVIRFSLLSFAIISPALACARMKPTDGGIAVVDCNSCTQAKLPTFALAMAATDKWADEKMVVDDTTTKCKAVNAKCTQNPAAPARDGVKIDKTTVPSADFKLVCSSAGKWTAANMGDEVTTATCGVGPMPCQTCKVTAFTATPIDKKGQWTGDKTIVPDANGCYEINAMCTDLDPKTGKGHGYTVENIATVNPAMTVLKLTCNAGMWSSGGQTVTKATCGADIL